MEDNFVWDDTLVNQFVHDVVMGNLGFTYDAMNKFKESKKPKQDWEIIEYGYAQNNHNEIEQKYINKIKRLSDNEVFSIVDKFLADAGCELTIEIFQVVEENVKVWSKEFGYWLLQHIRHLPKPRIPLFTTEDGLEIYESEPLWIVFKTFEKKYGIVSPTPNVMEFYHKPENNKYFKSEEKAKEYILNNKPIQVSFKEIDDYYKNIYGEGTVYYSPTHLKNLFKSKINP